METNSISFITACMGRLHHLEQTMPKNIRIAAASGVPVEFILLNYHSPDGMEDWVRGQWMAQIESGIVTYLRTDTPTFFHHAQARNVAAMLTSGAVICNLDADNYLTTGYIDKLANLRLGNYLHFDQFVPGTFGRLGLFRHDFFRLRGYNELLEGWGYEDKDLIDRAQAMGLTADFADISPADVIKHPNEDRSLHLPERLKDTISTWQKNRKMSEELIAAGKISSNPEGWGKALVTVNFGETRWVGE